MISLCVADDEPVIRQGLVSLPWESVGVRLVDEILAAVRKAGEEVAATKSTNLRLRLLEAELGRRQLVMDDAGIILGEVSHQGVADQVLRYIVDNQASHITLTSLSRDLSFSSIYLSRVIKKATGYTFLELLNG
ncbi:MAG TPA: hypothetical protein PKG51_08665, partial [Arachnia sp.]|nr:hypothetical protein [Arachnia sp.]